MGTSRHANRLGTSGMGRSMRRPATAIAVAAICTLIAGCATTRGDATLPATPTMIPRPLFERELPQLLLRPEQVDAAMGATGMTVTSDQSSMSDNSATMAPPECLAIDGAAEALVYANTGYRAEREQSLNDGDGFAHYAKQAVVLFPTVRQARTFFDASAQQWPACHHYTHTQSGTEWTAGEISNVNDTLSTVATLQDAAAPGWACGRALALRNNVIIDVNTCSASPADSAVRITEQIGAHVTAL